MSLVLSTPEIILKGSTKGAPVRLPLQLIYSKALLAVFIP